VYLDVNANGIFDGTDTGIAGYQLFAIDLLTQEITVLTTASDGTYTTEIAPAPDVTLMNSNFFPEGTIQAGPLDFFKYIVNPARGSTTTFDLAFIPVAAEDLVTLNITAYHDDNNNGVRDTGETDFPGISVRVFTFTVGGVFLVTDENGEASKSDLVTADFVAQVFPPAEFIATSPIDAITSIPGVFTADDPEAGAVFTMDIGLFSETITPPAPPVIINPTTGSTKAQLTSAIQNNIIEQATLVGQFTG